MKSGLKKNFVSPCLLNVLEYLVDQMNNQYQMLNWHTEFEKNPRAYIDSSEFASVDKSELEVREKEARRAAEDFKDIKKGIEAYRGNVWDEMQRKVGFMLTAPSLLTAKIDGFLKVLEAINKVKQNFFLDPVSFFDTLKVYFHWTLFCRHRHFLPEGISEESERVVLQKLPQSENRGSLHDDGEPIVAESAPAFFQLYCHEHQRVQGFLR